jgi:predicted nucleic acid-binding protein
VVELLLDTASGRRVSERLAATRPTLHVPHLIDLEAAHALRRLDALDLVDADRAEVALEQLLLMPLSRYPHEVLLPRIWQLRHNLSAYDAAYVALAEALGTKVLTCDARLAAAPGCAHVVELLE